MAFHGMRGGSLAEYAAEQKRRGRQTDARTVRRVAQAFTPYKIQIALVLFAILITTGLGVVNPLMIARIFDDGIAKRNIPLLLFYVGIMFITPIVTGIV